jgi:hypothetical protein
LHDGPGYRHDILPNGQPNNASSVRVSAYDKLIVALREAAQRPDAR